MTLTRMGAHSLGQPVAVSVRAVDWFDVVTRREPNIFDHSPMDDANDR